MKTALARGLAALMFLAAGNARALAHLEPDPTGLWFDPAQPGWGLEVAQQGDITFAVLFTYDANHKPIWYVASNLSAQIDWEMPVPMTGTLYRTTGPAFSAATFNPHAVTTTAVGNMQISYVAPGIGATGTFDPGSPRQLSVTYSVDGVQVSKTLRAQTWSASAQDLVGNYGGHFFVTGAPGQSTACPDPSVLLAQPIQPFQAYGFSIAPGNAPDRVNLVWGSGVDFGCIGDMAFQRDGQLGNLRGKIQCDPIGFTPDGSGVPVAIGDLTLGQSGISGFATVSSSTPGGLPCNYGGDFGGVITSAQPRSGMSPDPTGVWFNPAESGWGVILTQQGPNIFAALFAYDADGKPTWWVASNVVDTGQAVNLLVGEAFGGTLYSTTGPYFGNPSDATALSATAAGTLQVANIGGTDNLALAYTVGSATVQKIVQRQTWTADHPLLLGGSYTGGLFPGVSACGTAGLFATNPTTFTMTTDSRSSSVKLKWPTGPGTGCVLVADYAQTGQLATLSGPVHCGVVDNPQGAPGTITITDVNVSSVGFAGFANFNGFANLDAPACTTGGYIGGVLH